MKLGKYWNKMKILRSFNDKKDLFISQEKPNFFVNKTLYNIKSSSKYNFSENELSELSNFYKENYKMGNNTIMLSLDYLKKVLQLNSEIVVIYKEDKIIGSMISVLIPFDIETELNKTIEINKTERLKSYTNSDFLGACASFLVLDQKYRKKGYGMALIQESLQILHEVGGISAYFLNNISRCKNSIKVNVYYYPLNLGKLDKCNFNYPKNNKKLFEIKDKSKSFLVNEKNSENSYKYYMNYIKNKKFKFTPNFNYWKNWIEIFPTYIYYSDKEIKGIFSFDFNNVWYLNYTSKINTGYLLFCLGENSLEESLKVGKELFDILIIYQVGDITLEKLGKVFALKTQEKYINFFNLKTFIKEKEFYSPLF